MRFRHRTAAYGWAFSACFLLVCALFTYLLIRDGPARIPVDGSVRSGFHPPWLMPLVLLVFWIGGVALAAHAAARPCRSIEVRPDGTAIVVERYPLRRTVRRFDASALAPARVVTSTDGDGDPWFEACFLTPDGDEVCLAQAHDRARCESACAAFNAAIGRAAGGRA